MKRTGYYVTRTTKPYYGHESGDVAGPFKSEEAAVERARKLVKRAPLGIYRVHSRRSRRDLVRTVYPYKSASQLDREIDDILRM